MNSKEITKQAIIAAIYVAVTFAIPFDQFRVSEFLLFVVYFNRKNIIGITLGCFIANMILSHMPLDVIFGTLATFISCYLMVSTKNKYLSYLWPAIINGIVIGWELNIAYELPFWIMATQVFMGELVVTFLAWIVLLPTLMKNKRLHEILG